MPYYPFVQVLRGIAALGVVTFHASESAEIGAAGVDLFFVISGFLMAGISNFFSPNPIAPSQFFAKRIIRIVPLYWFYTTLFLALYEVMPNLFHTSRPDVWHSIASYLFVPYPRFDGSQYPVLNVGWTLNLEMMFYLVFGTSLLLSLRERMVFVASAILVFSSLALIYFPCLWWQTWFANPLYVEFLFGLLIGWLTFRGFRLPEYAAWGLVVLGFIMLPILPSDTRALSWGLCATVIVLGAVSIDRKMPSLLVLIGDASYSIYLFHFFTVPATRRMLAFSDVHFRIAAIIIVSAVAGVVAYRLIEIPLISWARSALPTRNRHALPSVRGYADVDKP